MSKGRTGAVLIGVGVVAIAAALSADYIKGEPAMTLGPKSIAALIVGAVLLIVGIAMRCGGGQGGCGCGGDKAACPPRA